MVDSLNILNSSLEKLADSFKIKKGKGHFPYLFVNKNNLYYIGDKPEKNFYTNISDLEYNEIEISNWNLKIETLIYLRSDIEGLLEAILKFNKKALYFLINQEKALSNN